MVLLAVSKALSPQKNAKKKEPTLWTVLSFLAPPVRLELTTLRLTAACSTDWAKEEYAKLSKNIFPLSFFCVGLDLFSRTASRRVSSAPHSLTSVFGMGTGGPHALWALTELVHLQGLEPWTHWLRVNCSTNWAKGAFPLRLTPHLGFLSRITNEKPNKRANGANSNKGKFKPSVY